MKTLRVAALLSLSLTGCVGQPSNVSADDEASCIPGSGGCPRLPVIGEQSQGRHLSGDVFAEGLMVPYNAVTVGGVAATAATVLKGTLYAKVNNAWVSGESLKGATMTATGPGITPVKLHIVEVDPSSSDEDSYLNSVDPSGSTYLYTVNYVDTAGAEHPLCNVDDSWDTATGRYHDSVKALVMPIWYDAKGNQMVGMTPTPLVSVNNPPTGKGFAFACTSGVSAKCYKWGYMPWLQPDPNRPGQMAQTHWACTRAARADYCGDGTTHTYDNTPVYVFDDIEPNAVRGDQPPPFTNVGGGVATVGVSRFASFRQQLPFEAGWSTDGAACLSHARWKSMPNNVCANIDSPFQYYDPIDGVLIQHSCENAADAELQARNNGWSTPVFFNRSDINAVLMPQRWPPPIAVNSGTLVAK